MYYLFLKGEELEQYKEKFNKVKKSIENGITPVFNEMSCAKTNLIESLPYNFLLGFFTIIGSLSLSFINVNEIVKIGIVLVLNNFLGTISNFIFTRIKHLLRIRLCKRMKIEPTDSNIAVMESLEYQTVS